MTFKFYEAFFHTYNLILRPEFEATTTDQILLMIKNDLGIGFIPEIYVKELLVKKEVYQLPLLESIPKREICFIENEQYPLSIASKEFKSLLMNYFESCFE